MAKSKSINVYEVRSNLDTVWLYLYLLQKEAKTNVELIDKHLSDEKFKEIMDLKGIYREIQSFYSAYSVKTKNIEKLINNLKKMTGTFKVGKHK